MTKITEPQKEEIMELTKDHREALVAYGADLYTQGHTEGFGKGFGFAVAIWATCFVIGYGIGMIKFVAGKNKV